MENTYPSCTQTSGGVFRPSSATIDETGRTSCKPINIVRISWPYFILAPVIARSRLIFVAHLSHLCVALPDS